MATILMARRRALARRALALLAAAATGFSVWSYLSWLRAQVPVAGPLVPLLVAARDVDPGETLDPGVLTVARHPLRYLPPGALRGPDDAAGRVAAVPIFQGEAVTARKLARAGGLSSVVPPGMRAYALAAPSGFLPRPGDRVDVLATFPQEVLGEPATVTVLRWREVAAVGGGTGSPAGRRGLLGGEPEPLEASGTARITLLLTPEEAERLALAEALGRVTIVLGPAREDGAPPPHPVTPRDVGG